LGSLPRLLLRVLCSLLGRHQPRSLPRLLRLLTHCSARLRVPRRTQLIPLRLRATRRRLRGPVVPLSVTLVCSLVVRIVVSRSCKPHCKARGVSHSLRALRVML
jgi:hypothetical protein